MKNSKSIFNDNLNKKNVFPKFHFEKRNRELKRKKKVQNKPKRRLKRKHDIYKLEEFLGEEFQKKNSSFRYIEKY